ncbi:hypothetical protein [Pseudarthrobacter sp. BRE9]|uniref:hypothetical protein n=1 Tax=Pseudarthrobacter sp. BRE9 TaxID=2962582 RepID=UPI002882443D|nr:hypothetical protein [Pseudarthrobacter sp. BRE9]MDT0168453.1 hypothetical protein [Pseudarthrobacter sp. BRE9]
MTTQDQPADSNQVPILIFVPGLGVADANSADRLAEVVAVVADTLDGGSSFGTKTTMRLTAPRGLSLGKTVVDGSDNPKLQLFQFDYASALEVPQSAALPTVAPGMIRSAVIACKGVAKWVVACRQKAKTAKTKAQLLLGLAAAIALIFTALMALDALLVALSVELPWLADFLGHVPWHVGILGPEGAPITFGIASLGLTVTWVALRKKVLALADTADRLIRFTNNGKQIADTITGRLDSAIDELRKTGWNGPLHLLGYSFGSLVLFEALYPRVNALLSAKPVERVSSLVTIGCPLDLVRLFEPSYDKSRLERKENLAWTNIFNEADIFASNLWDGSDKNERITDQDDGRADQKNGVAPLSIGTTKPISIRYTDETIKLNQIFINGRTHSSYWGKPDEANCFGKLVPQWLVMSQAVVGGEDPVSPP